MTSPTDRGQGTLEKYFTSQWRCGRKMGGGGGGFWCQEGLRESKGESPCSSSDNWVPWKLPCISFRKRYIMLEVSVRYESKFKLDLKFTHPIHTVGKSHGQLNSMGRYLGAQWKASWYLPPHICHTNQHWLCVQIKYSKSPPCTSKKKKKHQKFPSWIPWVTHPRGSGL